MTATLAPQLPALEEGPAPKAARAWLPSPRRVPGLLALGVVLAVVGIVNFHGLFTAPMRFDDEGTYVSQAIAVLHGHLAPYTYWYDHPPVGWIILAGWMGTIGQLWHAPNPIATGREFMLLLDLASVALLYVAARRLALSRPAAAAAGLLFGLSPLAVSFHRMVLLDNIATPLLLAAVVLALSPQRRLGATMASGATFGLAVLSKETVLLVAPFVLWLLWNNARRETRRMTITVFCLAFVVPALLFVLFAVTRDELLAGGGHVSLVKGIVFQLTGRTSSGSVLSSHSDAHRTVSNWLALDPWLVTTGVVLALPALVVRRLRPIAAALVFLVVMLLRPGYLPIPYVIAVLPLAALVIVGVVDIAVRRAGALALRDTGKGGLRARAARAAGALVVLATVAAAGTVYARAEPRWRAGDSALENDDLDAPYQQTSQWLRASVPPTSTLLVDNVVWTDLRASGFQQRHLVWFTKVGVDPSVDKMVRSWRSFDYVVSTEIMRTAPTSTATIREVMAHAEPVAVFGSGSARIVISRVVP
jgi:4-amino-4-deoxy-L-arabinose transferase-like glycosyltransferase